MSAECTRLSSADAAWLRMDRPTNLMVINSVLLFDEKLDWERLTEVIQRRLVDPYPRFRQRISEGRLPPRAAHWVRDAEFDISRHLHHRGLAAPGEKEVVVPASVALAYTVNLPSPAKTDGTKAKQPAYQRNFESWVDFFLHRQNAQN